MRRIITLAFLCLGLFLPFVSSPSLEAQSPADDGRPDQVVLRPRAGLAPASAGESLFPANQASRPFTHMLLRREAHVPDGAELNLFVRVSIDGSTWTDWQAVIDNDDLWQASDGPDVEWSQTIDVGAEARFWQVRAESTPAPDGSLPELRQVDVNTVDTYAFVAAQTPAAHLALAAPGKPGVVSRTAWGCPDGQGSRVAPDYYPVNHLVVHHTADSNTLVGSETSWADRVRAEWSFHTYTRGWGDVGYNYLVDPNGVVYEGRAGGDDAVAFHDTGNYGSMGVVLIGTYQNVAPTGAAQNALVDLLAWKAGQKGIDPLGQSYYYGCARSAYCYPYNPGAITPNISGHRQVRHATDCPGNSAFDLLPNIRLRVKQALEGGGSSDNGDLAIDNLENGYSPSSADWHGAGCGYGGYSAWTYATDNPAESTNHATWRPNIPAAGTYRVYAYIPQGCGLAPPPYASAQARYTVNYSGGSKDVVIDQNMAAEWVDLGLYQFDQGSGGSVSLSDLTGEPFSQQKVVFFDTIKWVPEDAAATNLRIDKIEFDRQSVASGELLKVRFTVTNVGEATLHSQEPQSSRTSDGRFYNDGRDGRPDDGYVYDEGECFAGNSSGSYASYPKESNRFRVTLGPDELSGIDCASTFGKYPWRWGLNGDLAPGETRELVGYVRFRNYGTSNRTLKLRGNILQEYVKYFYDEAQGFSTATITVRPEIFQPETASYDELLNPLAHVYRLGDVPDNFLARTHNPLSIPTKDYLGSFVWNGAFADWGAGGPVAGATDNFVIEQVRSFVAPASGTYTFRAPSDDGAWLWVDGKLVVDNSGLHSADDVTGTIALSAGQHTLAFKYFERGGAAAAGYAVQIPGASSFSLLPDGLAGAARLGSVFIEHPEIHIAADDTGGSGVERLRWSWDGVNWNDSAGAMLDISKLQNGKYHLRYAAVDKAGNEGVMREIAFTVDTNMTVYRTYLPVAGR